MLAVSVPGSVVTRETAPGYLARVARMLLHPITVESSAALSEIERRIVDAGLMTWPEVEEIETKVG